MVERIYLDVFETDWIGNVGIAVSPRGLLRLRMFVDSEDEFLILNQAFQEGEYLFNSAQAAPFRSQVLEYLNRDRKSFTIPIDWDVYTPFQRAVLKETYAIPYSETRSYGQVAAAVGKPKAARAVGQAEKRNEAPLVIPCHRVIGADGSMTGYAGPDNTDLKARLLAFERGL